MMNIFKRVFIAGFLVVTSHVHSQNTKLDAYEFGNGLRFRTENGAKFNIRGYLQPAVEMREFTAENDFGVLNRYRLRRARLRLDGTSSNERFSYRFQVDLSGSSEAGDDDVANYLLDAFVSYDLTKQVSVTFGQRATFTDNRELFMNSNALQLIERSRVTSAFASIREFGLFVDGNFKTGNVSRIKPYFVLTNGDGLNSFGRDYGGLKVGGRLDYLPFGLFNSFGQFNQADIVREQIPKLVVGANYSHNSGMSSRRGREGGAILYLNDQNEESLPDYTKYGVDFMFKYKGFSVLGEFVGTAATVPTDITQRVRNDGSTSRELLVNGVQDVENFVKGRMMLGNGYNIQAGYLFKNGISIDGRYTHLDADPNSFLNNATFYSRPNYYTLGVSKYLGRNYGAKIQTSLTYVEGNQINDFSGNFIGGNEWIGRVQLTFAF